MVSSKRPTGLTLPVKSSMMPPANAMPEHNSKDSIHCVMAGRRQIDTSALNTTARKIASPPMRATEWECTFCTP
ncbi:hypothetical protein D3C72_2230390 [compost metagenome]